MKRRNFLQTLGVLGVAAIVPKFILGNADTERRTFSSGGACGGLVKGKGYIEPLEQGCVIRGGTFSVNQDIEIQGKSFKKDEPIPWRVFEEGDFIRVPAHIVNETGEDVFAVVLGACEFRGHCDVPENFTPIQFTSNRYSNLGWAKLYADLSPEELVKCRLTKQTKLPLVLDPPNIKDWAVIKGFPRTSSIKYKAHLRKAGRQGLSRYISQAKRIKI